MSEGKTRILSFWLQRVWLCWICDGWCLMSFHAFLTHSHRIPILGTRSHIPHLGGTCVVCLVFLHLLALDDHPWLWLLDTSQPYKFSPPDKLPNLLTILLLSIHPIWNLKVWFAKILWVVVWGNVSTVTENNASKHNSYTSMPMPYHWSRAVSKG